MRLRRGTAVLALSAALVAVAPATVAQGATNDQGFDLGAWWTSVTKPQPTATGTSTTAPTAPGTSGAAGSAQAAVQAAANSQPNVVGMKTSGGAQVLTEKWVDARTVDLTFSAPMVYTNATANPVPVRIILPVGFDATKAETYPVIFDLHGGNDNYTSWDRNTDLRAVPYKTIYYLPDGAPQATYTNYLNKYSDNRLQWMQFHTKEVPQILEQAFKANKNWAIQGISSGGYGSFNYAAQNPGMFKFAASYSGPIAIKLPVLRSLLMVSDGDLDPYARWGVPLLDEKNWDKNDPLTSAGGLRGTSLYISSGTTGFPNPDVNDGPYGIQQIGEFYAGVIGHAFQDRLKALNIPATFSFYELGEHNWPSWKREIQIAQPQMMAAIGAQHT